uniref:Uncharacterized protein n=1 Tax=Cacopsylla melanoneura TaxID=428564 RepID=A0A8D9AJZ4_9HEMI
MGDKTKYSWWRGAMSILWLALAGEVLGLGVISGYFKLRVNSERKKERKKLEFTRNLNELFFLSKIVNVVGIQHNYHFLPQKKGGTKNMFLYRYNGKPKNFRLVFLIPLHIFGW